MKKILLTLLLFAIATGVFCQKSLKLQVVYFHAKYRCPTCISIEENTKKTLNTYFGNLVKDGTIRLLVLNVSDDKNEKMVEKYQAAGSALFLNRVDGKKETNIDLTKQAFSYSLHQPAKFIAELKREVDKNLK